MTWRVAAEARLVDAARAHLVVMPVDRVGPLIASGAVSIDGRTGAIAEIVRPGQLLDATIDANAFAPEPMQLRVAYEDDAVVVAVKPAAMHVHPLGAFRTGTLLNQLLGHAGARADEPWAAWRPHPVHRLDRAARGLVLVAKSAAAHDALRVQLQVSPAGAASPADLGRAASPADLGRAASPADLGRAASPLELAASPPAVQSKLLARRYRATVLGHVADDAGTIDAPLARDPTNSYRAAVVPGGARAVTHYRVIERGGGRSVVELSLETGRTHQIRAHLASLGHPIADDTLYQGGPSAPAIELCATELGFAHPSDGRPIIVRLDA